MEYIAIGRIVNTHGIKGEFKIQPLTSNIKRFEDLKEIYLGESKERVTYEKSKLIKNHIVLKTKEYNNINDILKFKNQYLYVKYEDRVKLSKDQYFIFDLVGLEVLDLEGRYIGEIKEVLQGPRNDVYIIYDSKGNEILIPAVKEFVKDIDIKNKKMKIDPIEGMIP